eukprot:TRINITY_DN24542_c0_g1_i1.p1 TRINITY_DN24542_c0_g1~~TRINITY_DN24542_c0_g1_i1.p1  ORF type:complete len:550 (+),score=103.93 TRINITY_DN24542_c0_g1_i1:72-1652(+)
MAADAGEKGDEDTPADPPAAPGEPSGGAPPPAAALERGEFAVGDAVQYRSWDGKWADGVVAELHGNSALVTDAARPHARPRSRVMEELRHPVDPDQAAAAAPEAASGEDKKPTALQGIIAAVVAAIIAIDDSWIWAPALVGAVIMKVWDLMMRAKDSCMSLPAVQVAGASTSAFVGRYALLGASRFVPLMCSEAARAITRSAGGVVAPLTWGLRLGVHTAVIRRWMILHGDEDPPGILSRWWMYATAGAWSELCARVAVAPLAKVIHDHQSGGLSYSQALRHTMGRRGIIGMYDGMAPLRVEVPHMAILLSTFVTLREVAVKRLGLTWDENAPWADRALPRIPIDACCGGIAAALANTATLQFRNNVEQSRVDEMAFSQSARAQAKLGIVRRHASLTLSQVLGVRVPYTAMIFAGAGAFQALFEPGRNECGYGCGWGEYSMQYDMLGRRKEGPQGYSIGAIFGIRYTNAVDWEGVKRDRKLKDRAAARERPTPDGRLITFASMWAESMGVVRGAIFGRPKEGLAQP